MSRAGRCVGASGRRHSVAISSCQRTGTPESLAFAWAGLSRISITAPARRPKPIAKVDNRHTVPIAEGPRQTQPWTLVRLLLPASLVAAEPYVVSASKPGDGLASFSRLCRMLPLPSGFAQRTPCSFG